MVRKFVKLSKDKIEVINSVINGSPTFTDRWLSFFSIESDILFNNSNLSEKIVQAGIWISGSEVWSYELIRKDGISLDIDRYSLFVSGLDIFLGNINKNFLEHHSSEIPVWYN